MTQDRSAKLPAGGVAVRQADDRHLHVAIGDRERPVVDEVDAVDPADPVRRDLDEIVRRDDDAGGLALDRDPQQEALLLQEARDRQKAVVGGKADVFRPPEPRQRLPDGIARPEPDGGRQESRFMDIRSGR